MAEPLLSEITQLTSQIMIKIQRLKLMAEPFLSETTHLTSQMIIKIQRLKIRK